ncbi:hypothetical protein KEM55_006001 [Ascosphaera atra]|nr:hypothetical protein KEM55_006001 [Ascosphaera atra]
MTQSIVHLSKPVRMLLIGAPGVGKGTQTQRLLARYPNLSAISSGDLLRDNVRRKTELVPDDLVLDLLSANLVSRGWLTRSSSPSATIPFHLNPTSSFILDGFPRTGKQAHMLSSFLPLNFVVELYTPPSVILARIAHRWIHQPSGRVYNSTFNPPKVPGKDDVTGEPLVQRSDDNVGTWQKRLAQYEEAKTELLSWYEEHAKPVAGTQDKVVFRVEGNSSDEISPKLNAEIERRFG